MQVIKAKAIEGRFNVAIVTSRFNERISSALYEGACARFQEIECDHKRVESVWVPGAIEIPLIVKKIAQAKKVDAIIALGAVIRGDTSHYDYVCGQVSQGCQQVMLDDELPVIFGILTTDTLQQALDRVGGDKGHKGREAVDAAYEMVSILHQLNAHAV
jgi:6,7-dimethyl-8-ribityllumazine synthase